MPKYKWGTFILFTAYYGDGGVELPPWEETPARMFTSFHGTSVWNTNKEGEGVDTACLLQVIIFFQYWGSTPELHQGIGKH